MCSCDPFTSCVQVKFHDGETMTWNKVTTTINNLILGKIYVEFSGTMRVQSDACTTEVRVKFKDSGSMFNTSKHVISGRVYDGNRELPTHKCVINALRRLCHSVAVCQFRVGYYGHRTP